MPDCSDVTRICIATMSRVVNNEEDFFLKLLKLKAPELSRLVNLATKKANKKEGKDFTYVSPGKGKNMIAAIATARIAISHVFYDTFAHHCDMRLKAFPLKYIPSEEEDSDSEDNARYAHLPPLLSPIIIISHL